MSPRQKPPVSHVIFWFMENQQRQSKLLFWLSVSTFHNLCNSVARDEQTTSNTHGFPWEGPNSVKILEMKD